MTSLLLDGRRLEVQRVAAAQPVAGKPAVVLLHEGLGSVSLWRDFPQRLADALGTEVIAYSRTGYGRSDPLAGPRRVSYMHDEALDVLPALLDHLAIERPILFGHSDGGSIGLIHAGGSGRPVAGLVVLAPHVMVEELSVASIAQAKVAYETTDLRARLARHHADVDGAFRGWNDIWLHPDFRDWNIEAYLGRITCPVLAIQGEDDEYGTMEQIDRIARQVSGTTLLKLPHCGHSPHRDQPQAVIAATREFVGRCC